MLAIHGIWAHGALYLWAEYLWAEESGPFAAIQAAERMPAGVAGTHPYASAPGLLADVLAEFGDQVADLARKAAESELTLWLPSNPAGPLRSPELGAGGPGLVGSMRSGGSARSSETAAGGRATRTKLAAWRVPALGFDPASAIALLCALGQGGVLGHGGVLGQRDVLGPGGASGADAQRPERAALGPPLHFLAAPAALPSTPPVPP